MSKRSPGRREGQDRRVAGCRAQGMKVTIPPAAATRQKKAAARPLFRVRPAWAHTCGCKSRRKLITTNEVKRNCMRATECGEEAWNINCEPMNKNRIEGAAEQGECAQPTKLS